MRESGRESNECCEYVLHFVCQECKVAKNERDRLAQEAREQAAAAASGGQAEISQEQAIVLQSTAASALMEMDAQGQSGGNSSGGQV